MRPAQYFLLELSFARLADKNDARLALRLKRFCRLIEISLGPGGNHVRDICAICLTAQQMIGIVQRDKTFGMFRRRENARGIVDADNVIDRRMEDEQRFAQIFQMLAELPFGDVVEELALDAEGPPGDRNFDFTLRTDTGDMLLEH